MVSRRFEYLFPEGGREKELNKAKENSKENVEKTIIPNLEKDLISALSKIVAKNYIEQNFLLSNGMGHQVRKFRSWLTIPLSLHKIPKSTKYLV